MITAPDDGTARSHDEARALLAYAVPGARLAVYRPRGAGANAGAIRAYTITVARHGRPDVCVQGSYALPAPSARLADHARAQCDAALKEPA